MPVTHKTQSRCAGPPERMRVSIFEQSTKRGSTVPQGLSENSPAFQRRAWCAKAQVPKGRLKAQVPKGRLIVARSFNRPFGTRPASRVSRR